MVVVGKQGSINIQNKNEYINKVASATATDNIPESASLNSHKKQEASSISTE